jgi:hypothetical protein
MFKKIGRVYLLWASLAVTCGLNCVNKNPAAPWPTADWQLSSPAEEGISYDSLRNFSDQLKSGELGYIDGMVIIKKWESCF